MIHQMVKQLKLDDAINRRVNVFKIYLPYSESDHVLNIAYNLLAGGTRLEHLELRRNDEVYLNALGAQRIPDPTTAGDFCRRFEPQQVVALMETINETRIKVWQQQPSSFFEEAVIDGDGTMVETYGECKMGMDINYKGQWGYHPLIISLANTKEPLFIVNRSGNRPSHENAAFFFDRSVSLCRKAGFRRITLRGDTDFSQTEHLDRWDEEDVGFVFGIDAMPNLYDIVESLPKTRGSVWSVLLATKSRQRHGNGPRTSRNRLSSSGNSRISAWWPSMWQSLLTARGLQKDYRVIVVWKDLEVSKGQTKLFDDSKCFFYITNDWTSTPEEIVFRANDRCDQENLIEQHKNGVHALIAPLDNQTSNWAYMVMASLAWSLKAWSALLVPVHGRWKEKHELEKKTLLKMDFVTFRNAMIAIPAQIIRTAGKIIYRFLAWNPWQPVFFRLVEQLRKPMRC